MASTFSFGLFLAMLLLFEGGRRIGLERLGLIRVDSANQLPIDLRRSPLSWAASYRQSVGPRASSHR